MREIKFRCYSHKSKQMRGWDDLQKLHVHTVFKMIQPECKIMQYTGLKDKNGVEMYCGDIVTTDDGSYIVKYIAPSLSLVNANDEYYNSGDFYTGSFSDTFEWGSLKLSATFTKTQSYWSNQND